MTGQGRPRGEPSSMGVRELLAGFSAGSIDPTQALEQCLQRIATRDGQLNAFVWVDADGARTTAAERSRQLDDGVRVGPLHGLPIAVKELVDVAGAPSEYSSQTRLGKRATVDATVVQRLRAAGAVIVGTTRSHEFGWGITTQHAQRGGTRNPAAPDRVPGGSSGGAAAAVAAGMVPACVATDTGGSIRIPSAFCGVAGIKPTFGSVPVSGVVPLAPSLDTVGVIAGHVDDLWPVLAVMQDRADVEPHRTQPPAPDGLRGRTIGYAPRMIRQFADPSRLARYQRALDGCRLAGARLVELDTPTAEEFRAAFAMVQGFEAVHTHRHTLGLFPSRRADYGNDVAGRLEAASGITTEEYDAARAHARHLTDALAHAMGPVEALLTPVALVAPPYVDNPDTVHVGAEPIATRDAIMGFTVPQNIAGLPTVTFPAGLAPDGLPFGLQVTCGQGQELEALTLGGLLERLLNTPTSTRGD